ncbi:MAG: GHKL domain-containing protein [uncultured Clostridium sp.]
MKIDILEVIAFLSVYLHNFYLIKSYKGIVEFRLHGKKISLVFSFFASMLTIFVVKQNIFLPTANAINFFLYFIIFILALDETLGCAYILATYQIFQNVINKDIIIGLTALILKKQVYQIIGDYEMYLIMIILTRIMMLIVIIIFDNKTFKNRIKELLLYRKIFIMNRWTVTMLNIILLGANYSYYYYGYKGIKVYMMLINRVCIYFCLYSNILTKVKSIKWMDREIFYKTNLAKLKYNSEINKKEDEYINLLRMYNHDFRKILNSINDSIQIGDIDKAKEIIYEFNGEIQEVIKQNKRFSNNSLINAELNRLYKASSSNNIYFDSDCYIPENLGVKEIDLVKIFSNLASNAFEACIKQKGYEDKWINFKSYVKDDNFIIYQTNSFNGEIKMKNDQLITTKENKRDHGIGVESIKYIVNKEDGLAIVKVDEDRKEFSFLIKIPLLKE